MSIDVWIQALIAAFIGFGAWYQFTQVRIAKAAAVVRLEANLAELDKSHEDEIAILDFIVFRCAVGMRMCKETFGPGIINNTMVSIDHPVRTYFKDLLDDVYDLPFSFRSKALMPLINVLHRPEVGGSGDIYDRVKNMQDFLIRLREERKSDYENHRLSVVAQIEKFK